MSRKKLILVLNKKYISLSSVQINFMYIWKISDTKATQISVKNIIKITLQNIELKHIEDLLSPYIECGGDNSQNNLIF